MSSWDVAAFPSFQSAVRRLGLLRTVVAVVFALACSSKTTDDVDGDGISTDLDCDDRDPEVGARADDADCDGALADIDCDDSDSSVGDRTSDEDCDGLQQEDDCNDIDPAAPDRRLDADCDGVPTSADCDDADPLAPNLDQDCDGLPTGTDCDDLDPLKSDVDHDGDGAGACDGDCDDSNPEVHALDVDGDGWTICDGDCDDSVGAVFPGAAVNESSLCARDADGDGYGDAFGPPHIDVGSDCDDTRGDTHPGAAAEDGYACTRDADGDGFGDAFAASPVEAGTDCDDSDGEAYPGAFEGLLDTDANCDGSAATGGDVRFADYIMQGFAGGRAGRTALVGDVDGDGIDDYLVSAYRKSNVDWESGEAYLVLGSSFGTTQELPLVNAALTFNGPSWQATMSNVSGIGDLDGDGLQDFALATSLHTTVAGDWYHPREGGVWLFLAANLPAAGPVDLFSQADHQFIGASGEAVGAMLVPLGDFDGDGAVDTFVGAASNQATGFSYGILCSLPTGSFSVGLAGDLSSFGACIGSDDAGFAVDSAEVGFSGDLTGDGIADVALGASPYAFGTGSVHLIDGDALLGAALLDVADADVRFQASETDAYLTVGASVHPADLDGDGRMDLILKEDRQGATSRFANSLFVVSGGSLPVFGDGYDVDLAYLTIRGDSYVGISADEVDASDLDRDGVSDLVIGSPYAQSARVFLGADLVGGGSLLLTSAPYVFSNSDSGYTGMNVLVGGDVNGDGRSDLFISAPYESWGTGNDGSVYIIENHL